MPAKKKNRYVLGVERFSEEELQAILRKINEKQGFAKACAEMGVDPISMRMKLLRHKKILKYRLQIAPYTGEPKPPKQLKRARSYTFVLDKKKLQEYMDELENFELACYKLDSGPTKVVSALEREGLCIKKEFYFENKPSARANQKVEYFLLDT
jgi:hypothetical protein